MRFVGDVLLGLAATLAILALIFQGFVIPALSPTLCLVLRITAAVCIQWLFLHITPKKAVQAIPMLVTAIFTVWGFFLYLTSPSWLGATFGSFLSDYASPAMGCALVLGLHWLIPRIVFQIKKALKTQKQKNRKNVK